MLVLPVQEVATDNPAMKSTVARLAQSTCRTIALCFLMALPIGCKQAPPEGQSTAISSEIVNQQRYDNVYQKWRAATDTMPSYSKTTAYTNLREFEDMVACGKAIVPLLREKIQQDKGVDFVLSVAVVKIMGWSTEEFPTTDMTQLRARVLQKLDNPR